MSVEPNRTEPTGPWVCVCIYDGLSICLYICVYVTLLVDVCILSECIIYIYIYNSVCGSQYNLLYQRILV